MFFSKYCYICNTSELGIVPTAKVGLGTIGSYPTHWFTAYYKGILSGVIIMSMPNAFSKLLGEETKNIERLIARGEHPERFTEAQKAAEFIFPELAESEDEKIRRCISDVVRKYGVEFATDTITKEKMLAWLEKQDEMGNNNN